MELTFSKRAINLALKELAEMKRETISQIHEYDNRSLVCERRLAALSIAETFIRNETANPANEDNK